MARYVRTDELFKTARDGYHSDFGRSMADLTSLREVIEDTPTADVVEVENVNKTIDDLITEIHCLEAKCGKYEEENARLKSIIKEISEEDI